MFYQKGRLMKKLYQKQIFLLFLLPVLLLTGCWQDDAGTDTGIIQSDSSETTSPDELKLPASFSLPYDASQTLDPITCPDGIQQTVGSLLYEGLFELDGSFTPQPKLCSAYHYDAASLTYTFTLRSGIKFSDGSALTAADAAASLNRALTSDRYRARLAEIQSVAAGDGAVTIVLKENNTGLPALLDVPIVKSGTESDLVPVGTGPYVYVSDAGSPCLKINGSWWGGSNQPVDQIGLVDCKDEDAVLYHFTSYDIQLLTSDLTGTDPVSATGNIRFDDANSTTLQYIGFNMKNPLFSSAVLRRALSLGIDRSSVVSAVLSGHALPAQFPISPASSLYPASLAADYSYDAFGSAMATAGYTVGSSRPVTMIVNAENPFKVAAAKYIAAALSAFDLDIEVSALPWDEYTAALQNGNYDLYYGEVRLTADWNIAPLVQTGGSLNFGGFSDSTLDLLLSEYAAASDRTAAMEALCRGLQMQAPILPVCFKSTSVLSQKGVTEGLTPTAANPFYGLNFKIHLET